MFRPNTNALLKDEVSTYLLTTAVPGGALYSFLEVEVRVKGGLRRVNGGYLERLECKRGSEKDLGVHKGVRRILFEWNEA